MGFRVRRTFLATLVALASAFPPSVPAIGPLDNDAGSGRDAGDAPDEAVELDPGTYEGTLTPGLDTIDYYSFLGESHGIVNLTFSMPNRAGTLSLQSSSGHVFGGLLPEGSGTFVLPTTGTWLLRFDLRYTGYGGPPATYSFHLDIIRLAHVVVFDSPHLWQAVEVSWNRSAMFAFHIFMNPQSNITHPFGTMTSLAFDYEGPNGRVHPGKWTYVYRQTHTGHRVVLQPSPAPSPELPGLPPGVYDAEDRQFGQPWHGAGISCRDCGGTAELRALRTRNDQPWIIALASTHPFRYASAAGKDVHRWSEADAASDVQVGIPGLYVTGNRDLALELAPHHELSFVPWGATAAVTDPAGKRVVLDCRVPRLGCQFFNWPRQPAGLWTFHLDPRAMGGDEADMLYLVAAPFPVLGLANESEDAGGSAQPAHKLGGGESASDSASTSPETGNMRPGNRTPGLGVPLLLAAVGLVAGPFRGSRRRREPAGSGRAAAT